MSEGQQPSKKPKTGSQVQQVSQQTLSMSASPPAISLLDMPQDILVNILSKPVLSYNDLGLFFKAVPPFEHTMACKQGSVELLERMLEREDCCDVNDYDNRHIWGYAEWRTKPPLTYAIRSGNAELVRCLISKGANAKIQTSLPLYEAVLLNHVEVAKVLIDAGVDMNANRNDPRCNALHMAVSQKSANMVALLLDNGADFTASNWSRRQPLHTAAQGSNIQIAEMLLAKGASLTAVDSDGCKPLIFAQEPEMIEFLISKGATLMEPGHAANNFLTAAQNNNLHLMKHIFANHKRRTFNIDAFTDKKGNTALHLSAAAGHLEMAALLLSHKADINAVNDDEDTALHFAAANKRTEMVDLLLRHGADVEAVNKNRETALIQASSVEIMLKLLTEGIDASVVSKTKGTVLHRLMENCKYSTSPKEQGTCFKVLALAIAGGVDVTAVDNKQATALYLAAGASRIPEKVVQALLDTEKCDVNAVDKLGETSLHKAAHRGKYKESTARLLVANGAVIDIKNKKNKTPFDLGLKRLPKKLEKEAALKAKQKAKEKKEAAAAAAVAKKKKKAASKKKKDAAASPPVKKTATKKKAPTKKKK